MTGLAPRALDRCVGEVEGFLRHHWGRRPLYRRSGRGFDDLLSLDDVDRILTSTALRTPALRLVRDGKPLPPSSYTRSARTGSTTVTGLADPARIHRHFQEGATIVLQGVHRFWLPLARFCRELEQALGHPTQVNAYVTPSGSRGLATHHDGHDVFVLQAFGEKAWDVYEPPAEPDLAPAGSKVDLEPGREPILSVTLEPGDALYLPRGTPHAARAQRVASGHITVGILATTWREVLGEVLRAAGREAGLDERLPAGYHRDVRGLATSLHERLEGVARWLEKQDSGVAATDRIRRFLTTRPSLLTGTLQDVLRLDQVDDDTVLRRRPDAFCEVLTEGDRLAVLLGDRELRMPAWVAPALRVVADGEGFRVRDLHPHLDPESRLVLARRLIREGLLSVAEERPGAGEGAPRPSEERPAGRGPG